jgi:hypothetical protein
MPDEHPPHPPFRYFADPVCVGALIRYAVNRFVLKPNGAGGVFVRWYLNDLLCLPLLLPMVLYAQRRIGLRRCDAYPRTWEMLQHWLVFSVVFEWIVPSFPAWFRSTADPLDVVAYLVGGIGALLWWKHRQRIVVTCRRFYDPGGEPVPVV